MTTSPYFNHTTARNEQSFFEDLIVESIQIGGHDIHYIPRDSGVDPVLGETFQNTFNTHRVIEIYIDNPEQYGGQGDLLSKFGLMIQDDLTLRVSRKRFEEELGDLRDRPREGDLFFIGDPQNSDDSFINSIFEITYVSNTRPFWQLGQSVVYEFKAQRFAFGQEKFETGLESVDNLFAELTNDKALSVPEMITGAAGNTAISEAFEGLANFDEKNPFSAF